MRSSGNRCVGSNPTLSAEDPSLIGADLFLYYSYPVKHASCGPKLSFIPQKLKCKPFPGFLSLPEDRNDIGIKKIQYQPPKKGG